VVKLNWKSKHFVPWKIDRKHLLIYLMENLKHVTTGYYTMKCKSLDSLSVWLAFILSHVKRTIERTGILQNEIW
jgi:hypothetical protein